MTRWCGWLVIYGVLLGFAASGAARAWPLPLWMLLCVAVGFFANRAAGVLVGGASTLRRKLVIEWIVLAATAAGMLHGACA